MIAIIGIAIPASIGFSKYIDSHVDSRILPISERLKEMHKDIREIRFFMMRKK